MLKVNYALSPLRLDPVTLGPKFLFFAMPAIVVFQPAVKSLGKLGIFVVKTPRFVAALISALSQENLFSGFVTRQDTNQPAQLQRVARILKFWI